MKQKKAIKTNNSYNKHTQKIARKTAEIDWPKQETTFKTKKQSKGNNNTRKRHKRK